MNELSRDRIDGWIRQSAAPVFVDVWGPRCQPCLRLAPAYEALSDRFGHRARFLKLEAPKNRMACVDLKVMSLPTFLHYRDGEEIGRLTGEDVTDEELTAWVEDLLDRAS